MSYNTDNLADSFRRFIVGGSKIVLVKTPTGWEISFKTNS